MVLIVDFPELILPEKSSSTALLVQFRQVMKDKKEQRQNYEQNMAKLQTLKSTIDSIEHVKNKFTSEKEKFDYLKYGPQISEQDKNKYRKMQVTYKAAQSLTDIVSLKDKENRTFCTNGKTIVPADNLSKDVVKKLLAKE